MVEAECPLFEQCAFFNDWFATMPEKAEKLKQRYCEGDFKNCARYYLHEATGIKHQTLLPDDHEHMGEIISQLNRERAAKSGLY